MLSAKAYKALFENMGERKMPNSASNFGDSKCSIGDVMTIINSLAKLQTNGDIPEEDQLDRSTLFFKNIFFYYFNQNLGS